MFLARCFELRGTACRWGYGIVAQCLRLCAAGAGIGGGSRGAGGTVTINGENVTAYIKDRVLYLKGSGAMNDFASAEAVPWAAVAGDVTAVTVEDGVTKIGKNAWAGTADAVTINGTALSVIGFAALGLASGEPVIPEGKVLVSKEEIAAAKAETVTVDGGVVTLGVTVNTNGDLTAETKSWQPVELKGGNVKVENGKIVITIPVDSQSGFMILQSGDASVPTEEAAACPR